MKIDLNCDLGEAFGVYDMGMDEELIRNVTSINVACGFHAGDPMVMERTVKLAAKYNVAVGAHPGFNDLQGFGRRNIAMSEDDVRVMVKYQVGALMAFLKGEGIQLQHIKPHGALYNMAAVDANIARGICRAIKEIDPQIILLAPASSEMERMALDMNINLAREVFADRAYKKDGTLLSRKIKGAVLHNREEVLTRVLRMVSKSKVETIEGEDIEIIADSICVHGDNEEALNLITSIREGLLKAKVEISSFGKTIGA